MNKSYKNFNEAYNNLAIKMLKMNSSQKEDNESKIIKLLLSPKILSEVEKKVEISNKEYQNQLCLKLYHQNKILEENNKNLASKYETEMLKDCTFCPVINDKPENRRKFEDFLNFQEDFLKNKNEKNDKKVNFS